MCKPATAPAILILALLGACTGGGKEPVETGPAETSGPTDTPPTDTDPGVGDPFADVPDAVYGIPNVDDDNRDGDPDWDDRDEDDNDFAELVLPAALFESVGGGQVVLTLEDSNGEVRVWWDGSIALEEGEEARFNARDTDETFHVEFEDFLSEASLVVTREVDGVAEDSVEIRLLASPLILNHHLQPSEHTWMMELTQWGGNAQMVDEYETALSDDFSTLSQTAYQYDVWVQDEIEFATVTAPGHRVDVVIDSIRDRGLDPFPEYELEAPDFAVMTWGSGFATSQDSFGNMEVTPPFSANGVDYPFGRIYYGAYGFYSPTDTLTDFLKDQKVQDPIEFDSSWLCVGHVDEFMSFIPDPTAPRGFRLIMSDIYLAYDLLETMNRNTSLPRYQSGHGFSTIGAILDDHELRLLNEELQDDDIEPILDMFTDEMDLQPEEIVRFPALFETVSGCGGTVAALIPGTINLIVGNRTDGENRIFFADPFFRSNDGDLASDEMIPHMEALLPAATELHWMDDWDVYHMGLGEVHCGTNVTRTPTTDWWEDGMSLIDG